VDCFGHTCGKQGFVVGEGEGKAIAGGDGDDHDEDDDRAPTFWRHADEQRY